MPRALLLYLIFAENLPQEKFHLRTQHSVLLGYWTSELGGLNQVVHLWQYGEFVPDTLPGLTVPCAESYSHRAAVRARLGADAEWQQEYFQQILPWLQHQDNLTLERWPGSDWQIITLSITLVCQSQSRRRKMEELTS